MSLVGLFVYCSRCRKIVNLDVAVPCEQTGRYRCPSCADRKVSA
jgi:DNA-directed RNA polymerase subunit RPC12/RpoP